MQIKRKVLQALFILSISVWYVSGQACNVCQSNSAACINETSFYLCYGGTVSIKDQIFHCADGLICSSLPNICFQSNGASASCGDTSSCGLCNENQVFACTSRNTFAFCFGATKPSDVTGSCPKGRICDASTQNICVTEVQFVCQLYATDIILRIDSSDKWAASWGENNVCKVSDRYLKIKGSSSHQPYTRILIFHTRFQLIVTTFVASLIIPCLG